MTGDAVTRDCLYQCTVIVVMPFQRRLILLSCCIFGTVQEGAEATLLSPVHYRVWRMRRVYV